MENNREKGYQSRSPKSIKGNPVTKRKVERPRGSLLPEAKSPLPIAPSPGLPSQFWLISESSFLFFPPNFPSFLPQFYFFFFFFFPLPSISLLSPLTVYTHSLYLSIFLFSCWFALGLIGLISRCILLASSQTKRLLFFIHLSLYHSDKLVKSTG